MKDEGVFKEKKNNLLMLLKNNNNKITNGMEDTCKELLLAICIVNVLTWRHGGHVGGVNKETVAILEEWNILLGIKLYFYANPSFCFTF